MANNNFYGGHVIEACRLAIEALSTVEPKGLDEAAEKFNNEDAAEMWDYEGKTEGEIVEAAFKAGAEYQYQIDRAEFAKQKSKEWQDGLDSGVKAQADHFPDTTKKVGLDEAAEEWCKANNKGKALCNDKRTHYLCDGEDAFKAGCHFANASKMEVDLEKEYKDYVESEPVFRKLVNGVAGRQIARHFYDLGCRHAAVLYDDMEKERQKGQEPKECICPRCLNYDEKEGSCNFPKGGLNGLINENGVYECNEFEDADAYVEKAMKLIREKLDLEQEYKKWWDSISGKINVEHMMEWYMHETARHFFELGKKAK